MIVTIMVGVAGSGKSNWVDRETTRIVGDTEETVKVYSSDRYRKKMFGNLEEGNKHNTEVFEAMHKDLYDVVKQDKVDRVYYDATNLSRKRRRAMYANIKRINKRALVHIVYMSYPLEQLKIHNKLRESEEQVPEDTIHRMYVTQQVPRVRVDCDTFELYGVPLAIEISEVTEVKTLEDILVKLSVPWANELANVYTEHDCLPWHKESVDEHITLAASNAALENPELTTVAVFHDLGKGVTKKKDDTGYATYFGHANVSASYYLNYLYFNRKGKLLDKDLEDIEIVHQHMNQHQGLGKKNIRNNKLDESLMSKLEAFAKIDSKSKIT